MKGKFIVLEGIDGSGTSTHSALLAKYLFDKDKKNVIFLTREPTKQSPYGLELRRRLTGYLLPGETVIDDPEYWTNLFINDRKWHLKNLITPNLNLGSQVISDRHKLSTIAYQSAQGKDIGYLISRHEGLPAPDLTLLLDISAEIAERRTRKRDGAATPEYFENLSFQEKVQKNYFLAADKLRDTEKIVVIDSSRSLEQVAYDIHQEVNKLYGY